MKKRVLGKGLGALLPEFEPGIEQAPQEVDIDRITLNPDQPRFKLDEKSLEELTESVRKMGILQPVLVRPAGEGYQLIAGERRLTAAQRAGLLKIPAVVREVPDDRLLEFALIENIQREQLNPIEEAQAFQNLLENLKVDAGGTRGTGGSRAEYHRQLLAAAEAPAGSQTPDSRRESFLPGTPALY